MEKQARVIKEKTYPRFLYFSSTIPNTPSSPNGQIKHLVSCEGSCEGPQTP